MWSILGTAVLHGCTILFALIAASLLGWIDQLDGMLGCGMGRVMGERHEQTLPGFILWPMTVLIAFGLPALLLSCHHLWQWLTVWFCSLVILILWAPVLCLAAHQPTISLSGLAVVASGLLVALQWVLNARKLPKS